MEKKVKYEVRGMTCAGCQRSVVNALSRAGVAVSVEDVSLREGAVVVPADARDTVIRSAIEDAGYEVGQRHVA